MGNEIVEKHQVAGLDEKERGFNRQIDVERIDGGYRASLRYEQTLVETSACETPVQTVDELVRRLQDRGYAQLRSRLKFKGEAYLGTQEPWIEYPDPHAPARTLKDRCLNNWHAEQAGSGECCKCLGDNSSR